ncbi:peptide-methionine (S)-S-oxide reductase [Staphylococcus aureus]
MTKEYATLAGGCFWCMVKPFTSYPGIKSVVSGREIVAVMLTTQLMNRYVRIKPAMSKQYKLRLIQRLLPLKNILDIYFKTFDPTDDQGQFFDRGESYTSTSHFLS